MKIERILSYIFPQTCKLCNSYADQLCIRCSRRLKRYEGRVEIENIDKCIVLYKYDENLQEIIHKAKYENEFYVMNRILHLRRRDIQRIKKELGRYVYSIQIPHHKSKKISGRVNLSEKITNYLKDHKIYRLELLIKTRDTKEQKGLDRLGRESNLLYSFEIDKKKLNISKSNTFLLVDDILTTGSTLKECAKVIRKEIPNANIYALVIASNHET
jgi:predicted amidophosphoribosyltransferase